MGTHCPAVHKAKPRHDAAARFPFFLMLFSIDFSINQNPRPGKACTAPGLATVPVIGLFVLFWSFALLQQKVRPGCLILNQTAADCRGLAPNCRKEVDHDAIFHERNAAGPAPAANRRTPPAGAAGRSGGASLAGRGRGCRLPAGSRPGIRRGRAVRPGAGAGLPGHLVAAGGGRGGGRQFCFSAADSGA